MNARPDSTDSLWWKVFFTPVGPRLVVGRKWRGARSRMREMVDGSNLPILTREAIVQTTRRTRLWQCEQVDVARELISHFEQAIEEGIAADQSVRAFGNPKRAAKLIRRAKRRNRPFAWRVRHHTLQAATAALFVALTLYAVLLVRYDAGEPVITRDYRTELNDSILALPKAQCGWPLYREAFLAVKERPPSEVDYWPDILLGDAQWVREVTPFLRRAHPALELVREAAARPRLGMPLLTGADWELERHLEDWGFSTQSGEMAQAPMEAPPIYEVVSDWRYLGHVIAMLDADLRLAVFEGDGSRAAKDLIASIGVAEQYQREPTFFGAMFSFNLLHEAMQVIGDSLARSPELFSDVELALIADRLSRYAGGGPLHAPFGVLRTYFEDLSQRVYTDDGEGDGRLTAEGMRLLCQMGPAIPLMGAENEPVRLESLRAPLAALLIGGRAEVSEEFERQLTLIEQQAAQPMWRWSEVPGATFDEQLESQNYRVKFAPVYALLQGIGHTQPQAEFTTQVRDATLTVIALQLFRREWGVYPKRLDELVPALLPSVPIDRFDGQPLRYVLTDEGPLLYSLGADQIDDGGVAPVTEDDKRHVTRYLSSIPSEPLQADWILWDGRTAQRADEP